MAIHRLLILLVFICTLSHAQVVTNTTELNNAIAAATAGTTITLANGTWNNTFINIKKMGLLQIPLPLLRKTKELFL